MRGKASEISRSGSRFVRFRHSQSGHLIQRLRFQPNFGPFVFPSARLDEPSHQSFEPVDGRLGQAPLMVVVDSFSLVAPMPTDVSDCLVARKRWTARVPVLLDLGVFLRRNDRTRSVGVDELVDIEGVVGPAPTLSRLVSEPSCSEPSCSDSSDIVSSSSGSTCELSPSVLSVRVTAVICPVSLSTPRWSFRQVRRFCFPWMRCFHSPSP